MKHGRWRVPALLVVLVALMAGFGWSTGQSPADEAVPTPSASHSPGVVTRTVTVAELPQQARRTLALIDAGGPFPHERDGIVHHNRSRALPQHPDGWYREYTVTTPGVAGRGPRRIVTGADGSLYWTADHYQTFARIRR